KGDCTLTKYAANMKPRLQIQHDGQNGGFFSDLRVEETAELDTDGFLKVVLRRALVDDSLDDFTRGIQEIGLGGFVDQTLEDNLGARNNPTILGVPDHEGEDDSLLAHLPAFLQNELRDIVALSTLDQNARLFHMIDDLTGVLCELDHVAIDRKQDVLE